MGGSEVRDATGSTFTELFESVCPYYLAIGMTYSQFWDDDPNLVKVYRKADALARSRANEQLWLAGVYMSEALLSTVGNMFSKRSKHQYPSEPFPITVEDQQERKEREEKAKMERIKAAFTAKALSVNAKLGDAK